jgi:hypothetical protein
MAKKIVSYKLNNDGSVPDFIEEGGYLAINPNDTSNMILLGVTKDNADISNAEREFTNEADALSFVNQYLSDSSMTTPSGDIIEFVLEDQVATLFSKLNS